MKYQDKTAAVESLLTQVDCKKETYDIIHKVIAVPLNKVLDNIMHTDKTFKFKHDVSIVLDGDEIYISPRSMI